MTKKEVPLIEAEKTLEKDVILDENGFFVIEVYDNKIHVEYFKNVAKNKKIVSGKLNMVFEGVKADALCDTIAIHVKDLRPEHYMYLGRELVFAEQSLKLKKQYIQGGC